MKSTQAGYSSTPLVKKLGLKDHHRALFIDLPDGPLEELTDSVAHAERIGAANLPSDGGHDAVLFFVREFKILDGSLGPLIALIERNGMIWVAWPKRASKVETDVTEDVVRSVALPLGLVDIKVCAVDAVWSGLKLVIRKELR